MLSLLRDVSAFVNARAGAGFLKSLLQLDKNIRAVEQFHKRIDYAVQAFNVEGFWPHPCSGLLTYFNRLVPSLIFNTGCR